MSTHNPAGARGSEAASSTESVIELSEVDFGYTSSPVVEDISEMGSIDVGEATPTDD
ncbi:hypothetical protein NDI79_12360 [Halogeometricum sp. S3BR5-2]|uniref:Uncharacterized protein n=1 Tax=Halogeometricum luteum TaxID=2950537 RepID=A0ABU2G3V4_9EURY|nr:hypothetical protein [Halogeometricum sp. S3BR5-2]MDS0294964.1 hypothetical protein [Halogeometricum sp. S3BR5-2]